MTKQIKIIILEDNSSDLDLISYELKKLKFPFIAAKSKNKREYIDLFMDGLPDIVLSDFNLPDMDGEDALNILREKDKHIPFILISALIGEEKAVDMMKNGANDYIMKDKLKKLIPTIERELNAYEKLKQAEKEHNEVLLYSKIFINSSDAVCILDENGAIISGNNAVNILAGTNIDNFIGKTPAIFFGDKNFETNFHLAKKKGILKRKEKFKNALGELKTVDLTLLEIKDNSGNKKYACIKHDITDLEKKKEEISDQKDFYESILENITNGVWVTDKDDRVIYVNSEMLNIAGVPKNEILGRTIHEGLDDETSDEFKRHYNKVKNTLFPSEYEAKEKTFSSKDSVQRGWLIPYIKDNKFDGMICTAEDVTEKVRIQRKLDEQKKKLDNLVSNLPGMAFRSVADDNRTMLYVSEGVRKLLGYTADEIVNNKRVSFNKIISVKEADKDWSFIYDALEKNEHYEAEYRVTTKYGEEKWVWERAMPVGKDDNGNFITEGFIHDITEKKEIELKIIENENKYRTLTENSLDRIERYDNECRHLYINSESLKITGFEYDDVIGKTHKELGYPDDKCKEWDDFINGVFISKKPDNKILSINNGENTNYYDWRLYPEFDEEDTVRSVLSISRDISELIHKEIELTESELKLKKGEKIAKFGYWQLDLKNNSIELSDGAREIFELEGVLIDMDLIKKIPLPEYRMSNMKRFNELIFDNIPYDVEYQIECMKSGNYKYIRSIAEYDSVNDFVFGVVNDITERKMLEIDLFESQQKFFRLYNTAPDMYASVDAESAKIIECNDTLLSNTGYHRSEVLGMNIFDLYHEDSRKDAEEIRKDYLLTGRIKNKHLILRKKNGEKLHTNLNVEGILDENGRMLHSVSSWRDITELVAYDEALKERAELLLKQKEELERSNKELEQFAYIASHDLQEPLRNVASFTQLLETKYENSVDDEIKSYINFAVDGAKRMQGLIKGLLEYSRISKNKKEFSKTNLKYCIDAAQKNLELILNETGTVIETGDMPEVNVDNLQMSLVFQNLIQNAVKFRDPAIKPVVNIGSEYDKKNKVWKITVEDNGIGIDSRHIDKIFTIFKRLHTQNKYPGTGIGLSVCKRIVELHGGTIKAESDGINKGSRFIFTLPKI